MALCSRHKEEQVQNKRAVEGTTLDKIEKKGWEGARDRRNLCAVVVDARRNTMQGWKLQRLWGRQCSFFFFLKSNE
jgi:ribosomal protein L13E